MEEKIWTIDHFGSDLSTGYFKIKQVPCNLRYKFKDKESAKKYIKNNRGRLLEEFKRGPFCVGYEQVILASNGINILDL